MNDRHMNLSVLLIRCITGMVFISEGIQKFLFPDALGIGRFIKIGIPFPGVLAPFVASVEIVCGLLILAGLFTRYAAIPLVIVILVAIMSTKFPILISKGLWAMAHEARTDFLMLVGMISLLLTGGGSYALDHKIGFFSNDAGKDEPKKQIQQTK
jgi:putative oxidoreductase